MRATTSTVVRHVAILRDVEYPISGQNRSMARARLIRCHGSPWLDALTSMASGIADTARRSYIGTGRANLPSVFVR